MTDEFSKLIRDRPADGVGDIDGDGSSFDDGFADFYEKIRFGPRPVLRRKFYVLYIFTCPFNAFYGEAENFILGLAQLVFPVDLGSRQKNVDSTAFSSWLYSCSSCINVLGNTPRQARDLRTLDLFGDRLDGSKIAFTNDWETSFYHVHFQCTQLPGYSQFLPQIHGGTRALFAIAQCCIED